jgi:hypothetical protein
VKCFEIIWRRERDYLKQFRNKSKLVGLVPPLRGLVARANTFPPLPRWASVSSMAGLRGEAMSPATGVRGDGMGPASGLRGDAMRAASDVAVIR